MLASRRTTVRGGAVAAAACLGLLAPSLPILPASAAGPTTIVTVEPLGHAGAGAAGSCLLYRVVPRDAAYEETPTSTNFVTVTLAEVGDLAQQDVDFCTAGGRGDTFKTAPKYRTGPASTPVKHAYNPGETVTPEEPANPVKARQDVAPAVSTTSTEGRPDTASVDPTTSGTPTNNIDSAETATLAYDGEAGGFVFGAVGLMEGDARLTAFFDKDGDGIADTAAPTPVEPGGDVHADEATARFTSGGAPWSLAAANAAATLEATPDAATVVAGSAGAVPLTAVVRNAHGHVLAGVLPRMAAESGPNSGAAPSWTGSCGATDSSGSASCSYAGSVAGTDTVALWVNQAVAGATSGRDAGEPFDTARIDVTSAPSSPGAASPAATPSAATSNPAPGAGASTSASPTPAAQDLEPESTCRTASVSVDRPVLTATHETRVVVRSGPDQLVRLLAYSRPSTTYRVVREGFTGPGGAVAFVVRPATNTRLYAQEPGCPAGPSQVIQVRSALALGATRVGVRDIVFRGRVTPARAGQLVSLYRVTPQGRQVLVGQRRVDGSGNWVLRRLFSGTGRFGFVARTGSDLVNVSGSSPVRVVDVR